MDCTKEVADIFVKHFNELNSALDKDDLSQASFPLLDDEARIELMAKRDTLMWVLEMLNISDENQLKLSKGN